MMAREYRILLTKQAGSDLQAIFDYTARDSIQNAAKMVSRILDGIEKLKFFPNRNVISGQNPRERYPLRSLPISSYIVVFRVIPEHGVVQIVKVRHAAQHPSIDFE